MWADTALQLECNEAFRNRTPLQLSH